MGNFKLGSLYIAMYLMYLMYLAARYKINNLVLFYLIAKITYLPRYVPHLPHVPRGKVQDQQSGTAMMSFMHTMMS